MITDLQLVLPASIAAYQIRYYPFNPHHLPAGRLVSVPFLLSTFPEIIFIDRGPVRNRT